MNDSKYGISIKKLNRRTYLKDCSQFVRNYVSLNGSHTISGLGHDLWVCKTHTDTFVGKSLKEVMDKAGLKYI